jgi:nucleoside-diphosphate-sugar epimerase
MKILITGCLGYIGTELLDLFKNTDHEIIGLDNDRSLYERFAPFYIKDKNINLVVKDICDDIKQYKDVDIVIHLAAVVGYVGCDDKPKEAYKTNIEGTKNVLSLDKPTVFLSSGSVYGKIGTVCSEIIDPVPETLYSKTKVQGESMFMKKKDWVILRPSTLYGISKNMRHDLLIHNLMSDAIRDSEVHLYQPTARRSFCSVSCVANLLFYITENFQKFNRNIFNVGTENLNLTKSEILEEISKYVSFETKIIDNEDKDQRDYYVNYGKLSKLYTGIKKNLDISDCIKYYKQFHE